MKSGHHEKWSKLRGLNKEWSKWKVEEQWFKRKVVKKKSGIKLKWYIKKSGQNVTWSKLKEKVIKIKQWS